MKRFYLLFLFLALPVLLVSSCGDKDDPVNGGDALDEIRFVVPDVVELDDNTTTLDFKVLFGKAPKSSDKIVLKNSRGGNPFECSILNVSEKSFTISLPTGFQAGVYTVSVKRGNVEKQMDGAMTVVFAFGPDVKPEAGSTVYGIVSCDGKGVPDVVISDGVEVVKTNAEGVYQMKSAKKWGYVFISVPGGYEVANRGVLPSNYVKLTLGATVAERADFALFNAGDQTNHTMLVFGDMHLANRTSDLSQFAEFISDVNSYTESHKSDKIYALTLGDMTWDIYWYDNDFCFEQYLAQANKIRDLQIYHTVGNHDHDMKSAGDFTTIQKYCDILAPDYYSFNVGNVHYIVLDDILCTNSGAGDREYETKITQEQIDWLKKDLSFVGKTSPVVVTMHAPVSYLGSGSVTLVNCFSGYGNVHFITGHSHKVSNTVSTSYMDHNSGAVCATWWWTGYLTPGIHICQDGAPGGYQIFNVAGKDFKWVYKATGKASDHQFRTYDRNEIRLTGEKYAAGANQTAFENVVKGGTVDWTTSSTANEVYINIWNWDKDWNIEVKEDGKSLNATQVSSFMDPLHLISYTGPRYKKTASPTFSTSKTGHAFKVTASSPNSTLEIKVTDRFGNVYTESMKRPKAFEVGSYK